MIKQIPNMITISRLMLLPAIIYFLWTNNIQNGWYAAGILFIIGVGDLVDGYLARKLNAVTNTGKIVDPMADKLTILVSLMMLLHLNRINVLIPILLLSREIIVITLRAVAASEGIVIQASNEGKRKTALQMFGVGCLFVFYDFHGASTVYCGNVLLLLSVILSWYSAVKYIIAFMPHWRKTSSL